MLQPSTRRRRLRACGSIAFPSCTIALQPLDHLALPCPMNMPAEGPGAREAERATLHLHCSPALLPLTLLPCAPLPLLAPPPQSERQAIREADELAKQYWEVRWLGGLALGWFGWHWVGTGAADDGQLSSTLDPASESAAGRASCSPAGP